MDKFVIIFLILFILLLIVLGYSTSPPSQNEIQTLDYVRNLNSLDLFNYQKLSKSPHMYRNF